MAGRTFEAVKKHGDQFVQNTNLVSSRTEDILVDGYTAATSLSYRLKDINAELASGENKAFGGVSSLNIWVLNQDTANATDTSTLTFKFYKEGSQVGSDVTVNLTSVAAATSAKFAVVASDVDFESIDDYSVSGAFSYGATNQDTKIVLERVGGSSGGGGVTDGGTAISEGQLIFAVADPSTNVTAGETGYLGMTEDRKLWLAGYDDTNDYIKTKEDDSLDSKYQYSKLELSATTGVLTLDMDGYGEAYFQMDLTGSATIWGSLDYTATSTAANYQVITNEFTGSTAAITGNTVIVDDSGVGGGFKYLQVRCTAATTCTIWSKQKQQV